MVCTVYPHIPPVCENRNLIMKKRISVSVMPNANIINIYFYFSNKKKKNENEIKYNCKWYTFVQYIFKMLLSKSIIES